MKKRTIRRKAREAGFAESADIAMFHKGWKAAEKYYRSLPLTVMMKRINSDD